MNTHFNTLDSIPLSHSEIIKESVLNSDIYVTNWGRIFVKDSIGFREIIPYINKWKKKATNGKSYNTTKKGYFRFHHKNKMHFVHLHVARTFVPGYQDNLVCDHIDNDSYNNNASNLQWITRSENTRKFWDNLSEEEYDEICSKFSTGVKAGHQNGNYKNHLNKLHSKGE